VHPAVAALGLDEKGFILAAVLARLPAAAAEARLGGTTGARCAGALVALAEAPRADRVATTAELIALLRAPVPAGIELVHPGWLRERLIGESNAMIRAITAGLPPVVQAVAAELLTTRADEPDGPEPVYNRAGLAQLRRVVFGGLVPLTGPGGPRGEARALVALAAPALAEAIAREGAAVLGTSLRGAPAPLIARAAATVGDALAPSLLAAARRAGPAEDRDEARAAIAAQPTGREACFALGLAPLGARLAGQGGAGAALAVAQRLPPEAGRRLLGAAGLEA
jgi:hypothetical protein